MGNNPNKEVQTSRRFSGLGLAPDERNMTPDKSTNSRRENMNVGLKDGGQRAKSVNQDSSFQRLIGSSAVLSKQTDFSSKAFDEVKKAENFCNNFINETLKIKLNSNLSQCSNLITVPDKKQAGLRTQSSSRFNYIEKKLAEQSKSLQRLHHRLLTEEAGAIIEIETKKFRIGEVPHNLESSREESPMLNYMNRQMQRKLQGCNTPSPHSRTSCTGTEESPHFARDIKNCTPSSKGKNSGGGYKGELPYGHMLSFGGFGQNFFMGGGANASRNDISSVSSKSENSKIFPTKDFGRNSNLPDDLNTHLFSFQQRNSPNKDAPPLDRKGRVDDAIEEVDEEARSSREEGKPIAGYRADSFEGSHPDDDEEDLDEVIEKLSNKHLVARTGLYSKKSTDKYYSESLGHKSSQNSNASATDPYAKTRDQQMMPHYHQLLQKGKQIDIKQSAGTAKTEARSGGVPNESGSVRRGEDPRVSGFRLDDVSKKTSTKEESLGTTFESARRHLIKTIGESYQSKESLNSLAKSSRGKETISQFDSEQILKAKEAAGNRFNKQEAVPGTQSMECRTNGLNYLSHKDLEKKAQSTGYSVHAVQDNAEKQPDNESAYEPKRGIRASRSPIRDYAAAYERENPSIRNNSKPTAATSQLDNLSSKNSHKAYDQQASGTLVSNPTGYLDRFQRKRMQNEDKPSLDAFRKSGLNFQAGNSKEPEPRRDPILDVFLLNNKPRTDSNPKSSQGQTAGSRPNIGTLENVQPEVLFYQNPKKGPNIMRDSRVSSNLLPGSQTDRRTPVLESIMNKMPVSRKEDLLVSARNRNHHEEQENVYGTHKEAFEERHASELMQQPGIGSKLPVKGQGQALLGAGLQRKPPADNYSQKQPPRNAQASEDPSSFKTTAGQAKPIARQSQEAANLKRSPSGNGGFNIKIDIGNLSSKMMANIQRDLP